MKLKDRPISVFNTNKVINCGGILLDLNTPKVMGILNTTPDSFHDGGKFTDLKSMRMRVSKMVRQGATIIDIGGQSTRPGAKMVTSKTELERVIPAVDWVREKHPGTIISIDTMRAEVASEALQAGAHMINDVSAGTFDKKMIPTVSRHRVPYVLMHMKGTPATMQLHPRYKNVVLEVLKFLAEKTDKCKKSGIQDLIIDPGFGFGKSLAHNYQLMNDLMAFKILGYPVLAGISRKSMIYKTLDINSKDALNGTTALHMAALMKGASLLRVHDVKEAVETVTLYNAMADSIRHSNRIKRVKTN